MLRRWIPALILSVCYLAFSGCQDSASAQNTAAPTSALSQLVSALIRSPP